MLQPTAQPQTFILTATYLRFGFWLAYAGFVPCYEENDDHHVVWMRRKQRVILWWRGRRVTANTAALATELRTLCRAEVSHAS